MGLWCGWKTVWILISWLLQKTADLDIQGWTIYYATDGLSTLFRTKDFCIKFDTVKSGRFIVSSQVIIAKKILYFLPLKILFV